MEDQTLLKISEWVYILIQKGFLVDDFINYLSYFDTYKYKNTLNCESVSLENKTNMFNNCSKGSLI